MVGLVILWRNFHVLAFYLWNITVAFFLQLGQIPFQSINIFFWFSFVLFYFLQRVGIKLWERIFEKQDSLRMFAPKSFESAVPVEEFHFYFVLCPLWQVLANGESSKLPEVCLSIIIVLEDVGDHEGRFDSGFSLQMSPNSLRALGFPFNC